MKRIPLHEHHVAIGGKMTPFAGFEMPVRYSSDKEEHMTVRQGVGVFDVSHMGEFIVKGPQSLDLLQWVCSNDISKITVGQAQYGCLPNDKGGIVDDLIVYKLDDEEYMLVVNASNIEKDWNWISAQNRFGADMIDISEDIALFAVQGPRAIEVLQKLTDIDLSGISFYHFTKGILADVEMIISATGYTGSGGFELYVPKEHAMAVWNKIFEAGEPYDIKPIGLGARDTLRLEMGYCLYGNDINDSTSPIEAGLGWVTKFTKEFINAEQLRTQKEAGTGKKLVGFKMVERGIPRHDYSILNESGEEIGYVTSGTMSPQLNIGVGLGYVKTGYHTSGSEIFISIRDKKVKAEVSKPPFVAS
ncbi:glycine cleavage system aminomethyltransferase GcvT [Marinoscillum sp. MHG1-6]|uniref:glycine cleavage system aminomethyltransferase GcvT n=1 Tax=Marinoscillum sp. MHG1-6 TaxID=2959627 RepID=UPI0021583641|nr:glycine cleavage system aminomethyltransferase GcvT [Marinoscillum sp. MHG1-6]